MPKAFGCCWDIGATQQLALRTALLVTRLHCILRVVMSAGGAIPYATPVARRPQYWQTCQIIGMRCGCNVPVTLFKKMLANTDGVCTQVWDAAWQTMQRRDASGRCIHVLQESRPMQLSEERVEAVGLSVPKPMVMPSLP